MYELFGAQQVGSDPDEGKVEFLVFLPDRAKDPSQFSEQPKGRGEMQGYGDPKIVSIQVAGSFQHLLGQSDWDFEAGPKLLPDPGHPAAAKGTVWKYQTPIKLPKDFYEYKYYVTFQNGEKRKVSDPCTRYGGREEQNAGFVVGGSDPVVTSLDGKRKPPRDLIKYELNIDDFTDEYRKERAPLDAITDKLPHLKKLGINTIACLPWTSCSGRDFSWGYTPTLYFSVEYRYANALGQAAEKLSWLKKLINACHKDGIQVIMDGVFNHVGANTTSKDSSGFPYLWFYQDLNACPYVGAFGGNFGGLSDLDYHNLCTQEFIRDACIYWIEEFRIDGIRFDNTTNFYVPDCPNNGLPKLLEDLTKHNEAKGHENFALILEHIDINAAQVTNDTHANSFWNEALFEATYDGLWHRNVTPKLMRSLNTNKYLTDQRKVATTYLTSHDHCHVAWLAGGPENDGGMQWYRTQPYVIALLTCPGCILIPNGQEFAEDYYVMRDDNGSGRRVQPRPLHWSFASDNIGTKLVPIYQKLIGIRTKYPSLRGDNIYPGDWEDWQRKFNNGYGLDADRKLMIFHRWGNAEGKTQRFMIVLNFDQNPQCVDVPFSCDGQWHDLLEDTAPPVSVSGNWLRNVQINSNWGKIYFHET